MDRNRSKSKQLAEQPTIPLGDPGGGGLLYGTTDVLGATKLELGVHPSSAASANESTSLRLRPPSDAERIRLLTPTTVRTDR